MASIGFGVMFVLGSLLFLAGIAITYFSTRIGDKATAAPLLLSVVGALILYLACKSAPFTVTLTGGAS